MQSFKNSLFKISERHPFHLVNPSPWPAYVGLSVGPLLYLTALSLHSVSTSLKLWLFLIFVVSVISWFRDIIVEAVYEGKHTDKVQVGLRLGFSLFIVSEVMFFFSIFWAYFHVSINPSIFIGAVWPPLGIKVLSPWNIPFLNSVILVSSGVTITLAHYALICSVASSRWETIVGCLSTIVLGLLFTLLQRFEYVHAMFNISDSVYGSIFFFATGFHGLHVIVGTIFLIVGFFRHIKYHFTDEHHIGMEAAIWYWHFVDVVWLFLFVSIYWFGQ